MTFRFQPASLAILTVLSACAPTAVFAAVQSPDSQKAPADSKKKASGTSLTGCVDQQEGHYVLTDDRNLSPVADLEADGFPTEGFAKHVGHKVTIRGISSSGGTRPVFKVRTIETVSETCAPNTQSDKK
jgi:hypothetical protein